jgi:hypothetical protein
MKERHVVYEEEIIDRVGYADGLEVVVCQPHLDPDLTTVAIITDDGRSYELDSTDATELGDLLHQAATSLRSTLAKVQAAAKSED